MVIFNYGNKNIELNNPLASFLGIDNKLKFIVFVKKLNSPCTFFIHYDFIHKEENLLNGKRSAFWPALTSKENLDKEEMFNLSRVWDKEKSQSPTGFEPMTSQTPVERSNH